MYLAAISNSEYNGETYLTVANDAELQNIVFEYRVTFISGGEDELYSKAREYRYLLMSALDRIWRLKKMLHNTSTCPVYEMI
jgi:hypothetical protein